MNNGSLVYLTNRRYGVTHEVVAVCADHLYRLGGDDSVVGNVPGVADGSLACVHCTRRSVLVNASQADGVALGYYNGR